MGTESAVVTSSRVKVWWLNKKGYVLVGRSMRPRITWMGRIAYVKQWCMAAPAAENSDDDPYKR